MAQRDYILRMIEQMGEILISLRNMIVGGTASARIIEEKLEAAASQSGLDLSLARAASPETIQMMVAPMGDVEPGRCWLVAEVLYLDGLHAQLDGRPEEADASFRKSLPLYVLLEPRGLFIGLPEASERIREIEERLASLSVNGRG